MSSDVSPGDQTPDQAPEASVTPSPDWADGLRQLYDSVVDEPLPDAFKDLLDKLDEDGSIDSGCEADGSDRGQS
ncbi:MAG: NepR family anti-sigma factor [Pseudomonadota bacterium]